VSPISNIKIDEIFFRKSDFVGVVIIFLESKNAIIPKRIEATIKMAGMLQFSRK
jgi:hypothetical protein